MALIDYYYSVLSPFTYLAGDRLEQIAAKHGAEIAYKPCDTLYIFSQTGGVPPAKRHPSRQEYRLQELKRLSAHAGLPLNLAPKYFPADGSLASKTVIAAMAAGVDGGALTRAFLKGCWAEDRNLADPETVRAILSECLLAPDLAAGSDEAKATFEANTQEALERGVFGAPFYIVGDERFWGQDRLDYLDRYLAAI